MLVSYTCAYHYMAGKRQCFVCTQFFILVIGRHVGVKKYRVQKQQYIIIRYYNNIILYIVYVHEKTIKANIAQSTDFFARVLCSSDIQLCGDDDDEDHATG